MATPRAPPRASLGEEPAYEEPEVAADATYDVAGGAPTPSYAEPRMAAAADHTYDVGGAVVAPAAYAVPRASASAGGGGGNLYDVGGSGEQVKVQPASSNGTYDVADSSEEPQYETPFRALGGAHAAASVRRISASDAPAYAEPRSQDAVYETPVEGGYAMPRAATGMSMENSYAEPTIARSGAVLVDPSSERTVPPRHCYVCMQFISGARLQFRNREYHEDHFRCQGCSKLMYCEDFFDEQGAVWCNDCHTEKFGLMCGGCNKKITEKYIALLNKNWHIGCLKCAKCKVPIGQSVGATEKKGKTYCTDHYYELFGDKCARCNKAIKTSALTAEKHKYHQECFTCCKKGCKTSLAQGYFGKKKKLYCAAHK